MKGMIIASTYKVSIFRVGLLHCDTQSEQFVSFRLWATWSLDMEWFFAITVSHTLRDPRLHRFRIGWQETRRQPQWINEYRHSHRWTQSRVWLTYTGQLCWRKLLCLWPSLSGFSLLFELYCNTKNSINSVFATFGAIWIVITNLDRDSSVVLLNAAQTFPGIDFICIRDIAEDPIRFANNEPCVPLSLSALKKKKCISWQTIPPAQPFL